MALYLQDQIASGLFTDSMKQEAEKQAHSLLNNNTSIFPNMIAPPGTSSLPLQHQIYMGLMAGLPMLANPSLFHQQQNLLSNWPLPVVSSPSPTSHHSSDRVSPVINNIKYNSNSNSNSQKASSNNNNNSTNNNNVVSSSADRISKRAQALKRKPSVDHQMNNKSNPSPASTDRNSPATPEATKDTRDRNFQCKVCNRSFGYKHVLQNHERTHTGEKPFECPECHKRFTRDHHLKTHLRLHTGEKPYNCDHCHRKFVQVANLRRHLRVHTGERPYICEICQAKFSDSNQLKAHKLIHDEEKPHKCRRCDMRFYRKSQLSSHKCNLKLTTGTRSPPLSAISDLKVEVDFEMAEKTASMRHDLLRTLTSPVPLNLSGSLSRTLVTDIPEQTEPEDLSMSTGMHRPYSRTHSNGDSPLSLSPSIDTINDQVDDQLDMPQASPKSQVIVK